MKLSVIKKKFPKVYADIEHMVIYNYLYGEFIVMQTYMEKRTQPKLWGYEIKRMNNGARTHCHSIAVYETEEIACEAMWERGFGILESGKEELNDEPTT